MDAWGWQHAPSVRAARGGGGGGVGEKPGCGVPRPRPRPRRPPPLAAKLGGSAGAGW